MKGTNSWNLKHVIRFLNKTKIISRQLSLDIFFSIFYFPSGRSNISTKKKKNYIIFIITRYIVSYKWWRCGSIWTHYFLLTTHNFITSNCAAKIVLTFMFLSSWKGKKQLWEEKLLSLHYGLRYLSTIPLKDKIGQSFFFFFFFGEKNWLVNLTSLFDFFNHKLTQNFKQIEVF